jgi:hypothetical protein
MHGAVNFKKKRDLIAPCVLRRTSFKTLSAFVESTRNLVSFQQINRADHSDQLLALHLLITFDFVIML